MINAPGRRLLASHDRLLNRLMAGMGAALVVAVVAFGIYYYVDRQPGETGPAPLQYQIQRYEAAVQEDPNLLEARLGLANLYFTANRLEESAEQYRAALVIDGESVVAMWGLGRTLYMAGDPEAASEQFQAIITAAQEVDMRGDMLGAAYYFVGRIALEQGDAETAIANLGAAATIDRADADALQLLGAAFVMNGEYENAIKFLARAVAFVPDFGEAYRELAAAYQGLGLQLEADYAAAMERFSAGEYGEAAQALETVTATAPEFAPGFTGLGMSLEALGERDAAGAAYGRALQLNPDDFNAQQGLARLVNGGGVDPTLADPHAGLQGGTP